LEHGADLVIELPVRFACASAQEFARGGVDLLAALGVCSYLSFGCEKEALPLLSAASAAFDETNPRFASTLRARLDEGLPYPKARALAAQAACGIDGLAELIARPNAALALEYLRALPEEIAPVPVAREGAGYHDETICALSSATAIRRALSEERLDEALSAVPDAALLESCEARRDIHTEESLAQALLYLLRTASPEALHAVYGMDEGLEYRFVSAARTAKSREELLSAIKTKRYTHARLSRAAMCALLSITKDFAKKNAAPTYARILGFRKDAAPLLKAIKDRSSLPLITKAADFNPDEPLFALDVRAQDLWSLGCSNPQMRSSGRDFTTSPVIR
ncbi:MAG: nucleotidyltransferase family protein, partial [Clostridia bacterium]|nr:nucleotidyltransferase family protein [Clostridia bacterium]